MNFEDIKWINKKFELNLKPESLQSTLSFVLLWNLLEEKICKVDFTFNKLESYISEHNIKSDIFDEEINFFKQRSIAINPYVESYIKDGLALNNKNPKEQVRKLLTDEHLEDKDKIISLFIIIERLRNNLFHGIKLMSTMHEQENNFKHANSALKKLLNYY